MTETTELPYTYYWCEECGWDSIRLSPNIKGPCPICAEDNGRDGDMRQRAARPGERSEGLDDRFIHGEG